MAHTALYRSYRPQNFNDVVGQNHVVKTLKNAVEENRTSHAYVFSGLRGIGKTTIARILARAVNCENPVYGEPCNECASCKAILNNETTDIIELDAASNNGVDEIRDILDKVNYLPTSLKKKVYIIDEVHMLTTSAFNALLKTLEEPPTYVMFVLATTEPYKIPATILSRCQRFDFKQISSKEIANHLVEVCKKESIEADYDAISLISEAAEGGMRDALGILDQAGTYADDKITVEDVNAITGNIPYNKLIDLIKAFNDSKGNDALEIINDLTSSGKEVSKIISCIIEFCRDLLLYKTLFKVSNEKNIYKNEEFIKLADESVEKRLFYYVDVLNNVLREIRYSNSQVIYLEVGVMKIINAASAEIELNERIANIEKQLENIPTSGASIDNAQLNIIENRVKKLIIDVDELKSVDVDTKMNERFSLLRDQLSENQAQPVDLTNVENRITALENRNNNSNASVDISMFDSKFADLEEKIANINPNNQDLSGIESRLSSLESKEESISFESNVDLSPINEKISKLELLINTLKSPKKEESDIPGQLSIFDVPVENNVSNDDINRLENDIKKLKESINTINNVLASQVSMEESSSNYDDSELKNAINVLESRINVIDERINKNDFEDNNLRNSIDEIKNEVNLLRESSKEKHYHEVIKEQSTFVEQKVEEPKPVVLEPIVAPSVPRQGNNDGGQIIDLTSKIYDINIFEKTLNEAITKECQSMRTKLIDDWQYVKDRSTPALMSFASILSAGQFRANGKTTIILSFPTAQICNMLMDPDNYPKAKEVIKSTFGIGFELFAIPDETWMKKRLEFKSKYSVLRGYIKMDPLDNPSLKIVKTKKKEENDSIHKQMNDFFGN